MWVTPGHEQHTDGLIGTAHRLHDDRAIPEALHGAAAGLG